MVDENTASDSGFPVTDSEPAETPSGGRSGNSSVSLPILKHPALIGDFSVIIEFSTAMDQQTLENKDNYLYSADGVTYISLSEDSNSNVFAENDTTMILTIPGVESGHMIRMRNLRTGAGTLCKTATETILPPIPTADPAGVLYNQTQYVMLTSVSGTVYYTLDGTTPDNTDTLCDSIIIIGDDENLDGKSWTLKAVSYDEAGNKSEVMTEEYRFDTAPPLITGVSIASGTYSAGDAVAVTVYADDAGYQAGTITVNGEVLDDGSFTDNGDNSYGMTYTVGAEDPSCSSAAEVPVMVVLFDSVGNTASFEGVPTSDGEVIINPAGISMVYIPAGNYGPGETVTATVYADAAGYSPYSLHLITTTGSGFTDNEDGTYTFGVTVMTFHDTYASIDAIPIDVQLYIIEEGMDSLIQFSGKAETDPGGEVTINVG